MRFFRGLAVPAGKAEGIVATIRSEGVNSRPGRWLMEYWHPGPIEELFGKADLSLKDTRPENAAATPATCACGDEDGAAYYAWRHNRHGDDDTPVMIEFEADRSQVAVDGRDCLYTVFQMGDPERARTFLEQAFGKRALRYAEKAWGLHDSLARVALCDLAIHDPEVIEAHHANRSVIGGRYRTVFRNAFIVTLPIPARQVIRVWLSDDEPALPEPQTRLSDLTLRK